MGHGDHFVTDQVYGVGIAAHGDDAYTLGHASLYQSENTLVMSHFIKAPQHQVNFLRITNLSHRREQVASSLCRKRSQTLHFNQ